MLIYLSLEDKSLRQIKVKGRVPNVKGYAESLAMKMQPVLLMLK